MACSNGLLSNCTSQVDITANFMMAGGVCGISGGEQNRGGLQDCTNLGNIVSDWSELTWADSPFGGVGGVAGYAVFNGDSGAPTLCGAPTWAGWRARTRSRKTALRGFTVQAVWWAIAAGWPCLPTTGAR